MRLRTNAAILGVALACGAGCEGPRKIPLRDTEGRAFQAICEPNQPCQIGQSDDGPGTMVAYRPGRVVSVCPGGETVEPWQCRPLTCQQDAECLPAIGLDHGVCVSGLCIEPSQGIAVQDAVVLCLAGTGLGKDSRLQVERYAMALQCGSPCVVPKPCRQL